MTKIKTIKAKPIETAVGEILPSLQHDKLKDGRGINAGSMFMTMYGGGVFQRRFAGKKVVIDVSVTLGGSTLLRAPNGRQFIIKLEKLIDHAIEHGLLDPKLRFEKE